jgi:Ras-related protein Rab-40
MMCALNSAAPTNSIPSPSTLPRNKPYDYLLKFLLVGDSDVGKEEILSGLEDGSTESPFVYANGKFLVTIIDQG